MNMSNEKRDRAKLTSNLEAKRVKNIFLIFKFF